MKFLLQVQGAIFIEFDYHWHICTLKLRQHDPNCSFSHIFCFIQLPPSSNFVLALLIIES